MKAALYGRFLTDEHTAEQNWSRMQDYAIFREWDVVLQHKENISDKGKKKLSAIFLAAKQQEFDILLVWNLECLGSSLPEMILRVQLLRSLGVNLVTLDDSIDFTDPAEEVLNQLLFSFSQRVQPSVVKRASFANLQSSKKRTSRLDHLKEQIESLQKEGKNHTEIGRLLSISRASVQRILGPAQKIKEPARTLRTGEAQIYFCHAFRLLVQNIMFHSKMKKGRRYDFQQKTDKANRCS